MKVKKYSRALVLAMLPAVVLGGTPAKAQDQTLVIDSEAIIAACSVGSDACAILIQEALAALEAANLDDTAHAAVVAQLSAAVVQSAQQSGGGATAAATIQASVLRTIAASSRSPEQAAAITTVASVVETGGAGSIDDEVFASSPA